MENNTQPNCDEIKIPCFKNINNYKKINNVTRQKLVEMVYLQDFLLKDAAEQLKINYSTAKTILRIFRTEKRIEKKNAMDERDLKIYINKYKNDKLFDVIHQEEKLGTKISTDEKSIDLKGDLSPFRQNEILENCSNLNSHLEIFSNNFKSITSSIRNSFKDLKSNQNEINSIIMNINKLNGIISQSINSSKY